jgi:hypothetical protein
MKNLLKNLTLVVVSVIAGLFIAEFIVRVAAPQRPDSVRPLYAPDDTLVFKLRKNLSIIYSQFEFVVAESTNSIGLRDREVGPKRQGVYRILGLGDSDSYANGVNLSDTYWKQLEACLNLSQVKRTEVINCAVPGYTLSQEVRFLKKYGINLQPDAVIVGFYCGNDFTDSYELFDPEGRPRVSVSQDGFLSSTKPADSLYTRGGLRGKLLPIRAFLATRSQLYIFLRNRMSEFLARIGLRSVPPPPDFCAKEFPETTRKGWELDQRLFLELKDFVREHNLRLIVVILPESYQIYEDAWNRYLNTFHIDPKLYDLEKPQKLLAEFFRDNQIEFVDALPELHSVGKQIRVCYPIDAHLTPAGHRVVAHALCDYISKHPIPPLAEGN